MFRPLADFMGDADALAAIIKALPRQKELYGILQPASDFAIARSFATEEL